MNIYIYVYIYNVWLKMVGTSLENGSGLSLSTKVLLWLHHATAKAFGNPRQQDLWRCAIGTW